MSVIVFSGGQDSTTCLYWAKRRLRNEEHVAVTFIYGQRHHKEVEAAASIASEAGVPWIPVDIPAVGRLIPSALTDHKIPVSGGDGGLPPTFVPGRNLIFMSIAAGIAASKGMKSIVTGVCQTDYSGYPDCRHSTVIAMQEALAAGLDIPGFRVHAPLMFLSKAATVYLAQDLGAMGAIAKSVTCYNGHVPGCGECPSCKLRAKGFLEAGVPDPAYAGR